MAFEAIREAWGKEEEKQSLLTEWSYFPLTEFQHSQFLTAVPGTLASALVVYDWLKERRANKRK